MFQLSITDIRLPAALGSKHNSLIRSIYNCQRQVQFPVKFAMMNISETPPEVSSSLHVSHREYQESTCALYDLELFKHLNYVLRSQGIPYYVESDISYAFNIPSMKKDINPIFSAPVFWPLCKPAQLLLKLLTIIAEGWKKKPAERIVMKTGSDLC